MERVTLISIARRTRFDGAQAPHPNLPPLLPSVITVIP